MCPGAEMKSPVLGLDWWGTDMRWNKSADDWMGILWEILIVILHLINLSKITSHNGLDINIVWNLQWVRCTVV